MQKNSSVQYIRFSVLLTVLVAVGLLTALSFSRLSITTNVMALLPGKEKIVRDAIAIYGNHPVHDQVAIDISSGSATPGILADYAQALQQKMAASGLFTETALDAAGRILPKLREDVAGRLPQLLTAELLEREVAPLLQAASIHQRLQQQLESLGALDGFGLAAIAQIDPLGLSEIVLAQLAQLAPSAKGKIYRGYLLSPDQRHLLLIARPRQASTDSVTASQLADFFATAGIELDRQFSEQGQTIGMTPVGAFRATLDNENIIRHDVQLALGITTLSIFLLLLVALPRPLISLITLLPAIAGTAAALLVYSLFRAEISLMVIGFSGALIAIMDDHSISFLMLLDRPQQTKGEQASRELLAVGGRLALLTTLAAFVVLGCSDFPVFAELGQLTALGFFFNFLFIHWVFPRIFVHMPPAKERRLPLHYLAGWLFRGGKKGAFITVALMLGLLFFARPEFRINLADMNTVSAATQAADRQFATTWGDFGQQSLIMISTATRKELQDASDILLAKLEEDQEQQRVQGFFVPAQLFPGPERASQNFTAWQNFWTSARQQQVRHLLESAGNQLGFSRAAFAPFFSIIASATAPPYRALPPELDSLLAIRADGQGQLVHFTSVTPGPRYDAGYFLQRYGSGGAIFDGHYFATQLADILHDTFLTSLAAITLLVACLIFLRFLEWRLTAITLSPVIFAFICTLACLHVLGRPLDIPSLMLSVVIFGIGVDFCIYLVCAAQWYGSFDHPSHLLVRSAVLVSVATSLIGFGVLISAEHSLLKSIGITSLLGLGSTVFGAVTLLPPLLRWYFRSNSSSLAFQTRADHRVIARYRLLEAYPRLFAGGKLRFDPLFSDLHPFVETLPKRGSVLDIGCGYGVPACWLVEKYGFRYVIGLEPDPARVRVARLALGDQGRIIQGAAPLLPKLNQQAELILLLDMLHYLDKKARQETLQRCLSSLQSGGQLLIRFVIAPAGRPSISWHIEDWRNRFHGCKTYYSSAEELAQLASSCGFTDVRLVATANRELIWLVARK